MYLCNANKPKTQGTMLTKFSVKNYRGFADKIEWDLSKPSNYEFNQYAIKDGIIKNGIIYGHNGSGKTNFGMAIFDIVNHLSQKWKKPDYYVNFVYAGRQASAVEFAYVFVFDNQKVTYTYSKNQQGALLTESLKVGNKKIFNKTEDALTFFTSEFSSIDQAVVKNLESNANNVSIVNFLSATFPLPENHYLIQLQQFANSMLWFRCLNETEFIGLETGVSFLDEYIIRNNLVKDFSRFLFEVSDQKFDFVKPNISDKLLFCRIGNSKIAFHLIASTGTNSLELLYFWISKLGRAKFVFIDEFDAFYHFRSSLNVCRRLFSLNTQVFLTTHNTLLMTNDLLRPDCNFVIKDNKIKSLSDSTDKELRQGHNIEKLYRGGAFN